MRNIIPTLALALPVMTAAAFPIERSRKLETFRFAENGQDVQKFDFKGDTADTIEFIVKGTVTQGGSAPVGPAFAGFSNIIKTIRLKANDTDTFVSLTPMSATVIELADDQLPQQSMNVLTTATADYVSILKIDMRQLNTLNPAQSGIDSRVLSKVECELTFGDINRLFTTTNGATLTNVSIEAHYSGTRNSRMPIDMQTRDLVERSTDITRADSQLEVFNLEQQTFKNLRDVDYLKGVFLICKRGNVLFNDFDENETIKVKIGETSERDYTLATLKNMNRRRFKGVLPDGVLYIPTFENGDLRDALPVTNLVGGFTVEAGVKNTHADELVVVAVPDIIRHMKIT